MGAAQLMIHGFSAIWIQIGFQVFINFPKWNETILSVRASEIRIVCTHQTAHKHTDTW